MIASASAAALPTVSVEPADAGSGTIAAPSATRRAARTKRRDWDLLMSSSAILYWRLTRARSLRLVACARRSSRDRKRSAENRNGRDCRAVQFGDPAVERPARDR